MWTPIAAGGTRHRLKPSGATMASFRSHLGIHCKPVFLSTSAAVAAVERMRTKQCFAVGRARGKRLLQRSSGVICVLPGHSCAPDVILPGWLDKKKIIRVRRYPHLVTLSGAHLNLVLKCTIFGLEQSLPRDWVYRKRDQAPISAYLRFVMRLFGYRRILPAAFRVRAAGCTAPSSSGSAGTAAWLSSRPPRLGNQKSCASGVQVARPNPAACAVQCS